MARAGNHLFSSYMVYNLRARKGRGIISNNNKEYLFRCEKNYIIKSVMAETKRTDRY